MDTTPCADALHGGHSPLILAHLPPRLQVLCRCLVSQVLVWPVQRHVVVAMVPIISYLVELYHRVSRLKRPELLVRAEDHTLDPGVLLGAAGMAEVN